MKKAIIGYQSAHNAAIATPGDATSAALEEAKTALVKAAVDCDASKLPDDDEPATAEGEK